MIYTNPYVAAVSQEKMHLWLDGMVDETDEDEEGNLVPSLAAMCGKHIEDMTFPGGVDPHAQPASETWAEGLIDLLGDNRICEECRTRAAVYFDRQGEVTLAATSADVPECPKCEDSGRDSFKRKAAITNIVQRADKTVVERSIECHECGHEWEDHVDMRDL